MTLLFLLFIGILDSLKTATNIMDAFRLSRIIIELVSAEPIEEFCLSNRIF